MITIKRGLNLPLSGQPAQEISDGATIRSVALIGFDYVGMKPTMDVREGDQVALGQCLFTDKKNPGVKYVAPGAGRVAAINRGQKRALQSIVIDLDGHDAIEFPRIASADLSQLDEEQARRQLIDSGLWTALRTRPFSKVPAVDTTAHAIFVNAMDSNPLAADPAVVIGERSAVFTDGLRVLSRLGANKLYCCAAPGLALDVGDSGAQLETFEGPHPAGLSGTHIHMLDAASAKKVAWTIGYQDVIAIGRLFTEGQLPVERVIALSGACVDKPRLLRTRVGASTDELTAGQISAKDPRVISGSVFNGRKARGPYAYLGRFHNQITVIEEGREREFMSYLRAGVNKHSVLSTFISRLTPSKTFAMDTSTNGSDRAMVPVGNFETLMPLDILPTQLLRALIVGDTDTAQKLGALELDEEDLALCTYACSGKYEYGPILRDSLTQIEKEG